MFLIGSWKDGQALLVCYEGEMQQNPWSVFSHQAGEVLEVGLVVWTEPLGGVVLNKNCSLELKERSIAVSLPVLEETSDDGRGGSMESIQYISRTTIPIVTKSVYGDQGLKSIFRFKMTLLSHKSNGS